MSKVIDSNFDNTLLTDNLPIFGYDNSRDIGILFQRYQVVNDSGLGDIVNDPPTVIDSIPSQSAVPINKIKLSYFTSSVDNFYTGWWIKINANQVRYIISYNGAQRVATLSTPFTNTNPDNGSIVCLFNNTFVTNYYDEVNDTFSLSYTSSVPNTNQGSIIVNNNANLRLNHLLATDTTTSVNASTGALYLYGGIAISNNANAQSSTYGGTFTTLGGVGIAQDLRVGNDICVGTSNFIPEESIHIRKTTSTSRFEHNQSSYSYIDFVENNTNNRYGFLFDSSSATNLFSLTYSNSNQNPYSSQKALTINNNGYIGINTTTNIISPLTLNSSNFISTNSTSGFLGLIGSSSNSDNNSNAARIKLNANRNSTLGTLELHAGSNGSINMYTSSADESYMIINNTGTVNILSTMYTTSSTTGALIVSGGVSIKCTENSSSFSSGGALTIEGGVSINKDLYLGGDLHIKGSINLTSAVTSPIITFPSTTNCTVIQYYNNNLITIGSSGILTFAIEVMPSSSSINCEFQFVLPAKTIDFIQRGEAICSVQGWVNNTNLINIYNILCVGEPGTTYCRLKFQSISTNTHYFTIQVTYLLN